MSKVLGYQVPATDYQNSIHSQMGERSFLYSRCQAKQLISEGFEVVPVYEDKFDEATIMFKSSANGNHPDNKKLIQAFLTDVKQNLDDKDYESIDELLRLLLKKKSNRALIKGYLSDQTLDKMDNGTLEILY